MRGFVAVLSALLLADQGRIHGLWPSILGRTPLAVNRQHNIGSTAGSAAKYPPLRQTKSPHHSKGTSRRAAQIRDPPVLTNPRPKVSNLSGQIRGLLQHAVSK
jgi:hypothetical protein